MAWFSKKIDVLEKFNPSQPDIAQYAGSTLASTTLPLTFTQYYEKLEIVNRCVNMIVDDTSEIPLVVGKALKSGGLVKNVRKTKVQEIINEAPNPYTDISSFKRNIILDMLLDGNIFIYFDGEGLYHLPAINTEIIPSELTYIKNFKFNGKTNYNTDEVIFVRDNSFRSIYRGTSRLKSAQHTMQTMLSMMTFQDNFFKNDTVLGLVVTSPNVLSEKVKERMVASWMTVYNPKNGGRRPLILDGGLTVDSLSSNKFSELDFQAGLQTNEDTIAKALGVPPILLSSGNNANIRPNERLYYLETVVPLLNKIMSAYQRFFGYEIYPDITDIASLQPELSELGSYYSGLVNGGIITAAEARERLGYPEIPGTEEIRIPANIAGSAGDPNTGGRPPKKGDEKLILS